MDFPAPHDHPAGDPAADLFAQNIQSVADLLARREARLSQHQRSIEYVVNAIGRPRFLYINLALMATWVVANSGLFGKPLDAPPFFWMVTVLSIESFLVTGMVLITQNRQRQDAERQAHLDLQINLLSEQKISKILTVLEELAQRNRPTPEDPEIKAMQESADPELLLTALEFAMDTASADLERAPEAARDDDGSAPPEP